MEFTGKSVGTGALDNEMTITFTVNEKSEIIEEYYKLKGCEKLRIRVDKYREKRSLDANRYFHVLSDKIAEALTISKAKSKNILICKYGQPEILPDGNVMVYKTNAPVEYMLEQEFIHCTPIKFLDDAVFYKVYRGSSTYDTAEMSLLIDGTVTDAKELKIETATPQELRQMKERWGV
ncbi:MAG TPA: hypothetical protein GXX75_06970 [Clostridiales bacterium]|nr:hypothetical protein [Clostridiales bacterium]